MDKNLTNKLNNFFIEFKEMEFKKGEILIRAQEEPKGIFYIKEGLVKMYAISKKGDESILTIFKPYSFFPMNWAINNTSNIYFFEAMSEVTVNIAPKEKVINFLEINPDITLNLLSRVYKGLDGILFRMSYLMSGDAYSRLITEIIIVSKRFGEKDKDKVKVKISENDLAIESGMTRETVSRTLKKLKENNLIEIDNKTIIINDIETLESEVS